MKEQIEEMAKIIYDSVDVDNPCLDEKYGGFSCFGCDYIDKGYCQHDVERAQGLYNAGYRKLPDNIGEFSDGYHTFNELYHHRAVLFSVICNMMPEKAWKSKLHDTGDMYDGMFIVGIETEQGQATYHYDIEPYWDMFKVKELEKAPKWDGHTPSDAIDRIGNIDCDCYRKQEWISVEDRSPEKEGVYLVHTTYNIIETEAFYISKYDDISYWWELDGMVTHWMPLPEPPKMKGGAE